MRPMNLNAYLAAKKQSVFADLQAGRPPSEGRFDEAVWRDAKEKAAPQLGSALLEPGRVELQFIYPVPGGMAVILAVEFDPPERIVHLPVPSWVIESIWQGEIAGSSHFESDAMRLLDELRAQLEPEANAALFGPQAPKRRE
jgi:hypothetical protein